MMEIAAGFLLAEACSRLNLQSMILSSPLGVDRIVSL